MLKKILCLGCLVAIGCGPAHNPSRTELPPLQKEEGAPQVRRVVCLEADQSQPDLALVAEMVKEKLAAKGYQISQTSEGAAQTIQMRLKAFDVMSRLASDRRGRSRSGAGVGYAAGTAVGGAVSGSALHAGLTQGGLVGGLVGLGLGSLFSSRPDREFFGAVEVRFARPDGQGTPIVVRAQRHSRQKLSDPEAVAAIKKAVAADLAAKVAALLP